MVTDKEGNCTINLVDYEFYSYVKKIHCVNNIQQNVYKSEYHTMKWSKKIPLCCSTKYSLLSTEFSTLHLT